MGHGTPEPAREPAERGPSPLDVLEEIRIEDVLALGSEGTEPIDWASRVRDRSGECPDCGRPDGPRHRRRCIAHPRPPSFWWPVGATIGLALPLSTVTGPGAFLFLLPLLVLGWVIRAR